MPLLRLPRYTLDTLHDLADGSDETVPELLARMVAAERDRRFWAGINAAWHDADLADLIASVETALRPAPDTE